MDQITLAGELSRTERLDLVGGMAYLSHLVSITPTSVHAEDYAQVISRTSSMRRLIDAGSRIVDLGYADTEDIDATIRQAEDALFTVRGAGQSRGFVPLREIYDQYLQEQASAAADPESAGMPIMSGFPDLDECLGGLQRADLVILGARPSMGKSSLAVNMAVNAAKSGLTCGVFSLEMTREQLAMRILASEAEIDSHRLRLGLYTHLEESRIIDSIGRLSELPLFIDDTPYQGLVEMRGKARRLALDRGLDLLVVDYLQLVQGKQRWGQSNRVQEITEISRELKVMASDLKVALIACSQLNRMVENRPNNRPRLSDLRDSGQHRAGRRRGDVHPPGGHLHHRGGVEPDAPGAGIPQEHRRDHHREAPEGPHWQHPLGVRRQPGPVRIRPVLTRLIRPLTLKTHKPPVAHRRLLFCGAPRNSCRWPVGSDHYRSSSSSSSSSRYISNYYY